MPVMMVTTAPAYRPGRHLSCDCCDGLATHADAEHAQIGNRHRSEEQRESEEVDDFDDGEYVGRLLDDVADRRTVEPLGHVKKIHDGDPLLQVISRPAPAEDHDHPEDEPEPTGELRARRRPFDRFD